MVDDGDVAWTGAATRVAKNLGVAPAARREGDRRQGQRRHRGRCATQVIGTQTRRPPARPDAPEGVGDGQPGRRRDAREVPGRRTPRSRTPAACAQDILLAPPSAGEQPGEITWGEVFAVLPFGNRTVIETLTDAQLVAALANGFKPPCVRPGGRHRPHAAVLGPEGHVPLQRHDAGGGLDHAQATARRRSGRPTPSASSPTTSCSRVATATRRSRAARTCSSTGDALLDVAIEYITAHSPVAPVVEGRIVKG